MTTNGEVLPPSTDAAYWINAQQTFEKWECPNLQEVNDGAEKIFSAIAEAVIDPKIASFLLEQLGLKPEWQFSAYGDFRVSDKIKVLLSVLSQNLTDTPQNILAERQESRKTILTRGGITPEKAQARLDHLGMTIDVIEDPDSMTQSFLRNSGSHETRALIAITHYPDGRYALGAEYAKQRILDGESPHRSPPPKEWY